MDFRELVCRSRSYRRFDASHPLDEGTMRWLVDLARHAPSAANRQTLKFAISCDPATNARIFPQTIWAGYLKDWPGPVESERPTGYVIVLGDRRLETDFGVDHGIAAQTILLGASSIGLGGCMFGSIRRDELREELNLPDHFDLLLICALGKPIERVVIDDLPPGGDIRYWRDGQGTHHVPKRTLDELIVPIE